MPENQLLYLSRSDIQNLNIGLIEIINITEKSLKEKGLGRVEMPPKPGVHPRKNAFIHAMPAYIQSLNAGGIKWVSGFPENYKKGLPYITGLLILNDPDTGLPISVMDCSWITAWRTAAATAVAAKYLANEGSKTLAILGCGVQGRTNLQMLSKIFPIEHVKAFDIQKQSAEKYSKTMSKKLGIKIEVQSDPEHTVRDADIIVTAGPILENPEPSIEYKWIKRGAFCCPLDLDSYFKPEVFEKSNLLYTDDLNQFHSFKERGYFKGFSRDIFDLGDLIAGKAPGRKDKNQIITSINIGLAIEDIALASLIYQKAKELKAGKTLEL